MANLINWRNELKFGSGDTIRVHQTVTEGNKTRTQVFEGVVIRIRGHQGLKSFTVRKIGSNNIGVERIFPENTPIVTKIEIKKKGQVRRAVLSYLRKRVGKKAIKVRDKFIKGAQIDDTPDQVVVKTAPSVRPELDSKVQAEEKVRKEAQKAEKAKKKAKKKKKIERKEKVFVR